MNPEQFVTQFESIFEEIEAGSLSLQTVFRDLPQWDSLATIGLLVMINTEYEVTLTGNEIKSATTIQDIYDLVAAKKG